MTGLEARTPEALVCNDFALTKSDSGIAPGRFRLDEEARRTLRPNDRSCAQQSMRQQILASPVRAYPSHVP